MTPPQPAAAGGPTATRWGVVLVLFFAGVVAAGHIGMLPPALPMLRAELGLDLVLAGWTVSLFNVTAFGLGIFVGTLSDRLGYRRIILGSFATLAAGAALGAAAPSPAWLLAARVIEGLGFVGMVVTAPALIAQATRPADRRLALGLWGAYMPAGMSLLMLSAPLLLGPLGWRGFWLAVAVATLAWAAVAWRVIEAPPPKPAAGRDEWHRDIRLTLSRPGLWALALCFSFYSLPWMALMAWLPTYLVESRGLSVAWAAPLTVLVVAINVPGNLLGGWLLQRGLARWSLLMFCGASTALCGLGIFSDAVPDAARYLLCLAFSGIGGMLPAAVLGGAPVFAPSPRQIGAANGLLVHGSNLGQLVGPPAVAAAVAAAGGWQAGAWIFAACGTVGVLLAGLVRLLERRL